MSVAPADYTVAIYGPNLEDQSQGDIHVHRNGCLHEPPAPLGSLADPWVISVDSKEEVVLAIYPPDEFEYDAADWEDYYGDLYWAPCTRPMVRELDLSETDGEVDKVYNPNDVTATVLLGEGRSLHLKQGRGGNFIISLHSPGRPAERVAKGTRDSMIAALPGFVNAYTKDNA